MGTRLGYIWQRLRESSWFVPSLMTLAAIGLVGIGDALNTGLEFEFVEDRWWLWAGGPAEAREMLSTIAGSMITVAGVVFSVTIVALTLASQQYGPRVLRNFLRDTSTQIVLGTFIATFVYCLLALRTVRGVDDAEHVPYASVTIGVVLALLSVGVLIHFIHHLSSSLQAENLIARVQRELEQTLARLYPQKPAAGLLVARPSSPIQQRLAARARGADRCRVGRGADGPIASRCRSRFDLSRALEVPFLWHLLPRNPPRRVRRWASAPPGGREE